MGQAQHAKAALLPAVPVQDVRVTVRGGAPEEAAAGNSSTMAPPAAMPSLATPPALVLAATHHKTGQWRAPLRRHLL